MDWSSASEAERVCDCGDGVQWPNDRNPIFFMPNATTAEDCLIRWVSNALLEYRVKPLTRGGRATFTRVSAIPLRCELRTVDLSRLRARHAGGSSGDGGNRDDHQGE